MWVTIRLIFHGMLKLVAILQDLYFVKLYLFHKMSYFKFKINSVFNVKLLNNDEFFIFRIESIFQHKKKKIDENIFLILK